MTVNLKRVAVEACAKVNLSLKITGRAPDGYHTLNTVMQSVDLTDVLLIGKRGDGVIRVTCSDPGIPEDGANIAAKAAKAFFSAAGITVQGLAIHIDKSIPAEAGLAGGSADAAAVLLGLDRLFGTKLSADRLREIGLSAGADVPFCLTGGLALAKGRGEILTPLKKLPECFIVLAKPSFGMSTRRAFQLYDKLSGEPPHAGEDSMQGAVISGDLARIGRNMFPDFACVGEKGETQRLGGIMSDAGALGFVLSGSGSAVAGLFENEREARACLSQLKEAVPGAWLTRPSGFGVRLLHAD